MGWNTGATLAMQIWDAVEPCLVPEHKELAARRIIRVFEEEDADTLHQDAIPLWMAAGGTPDVRRLPDYI